MVTVKTEMLDPLQAANIVAAAVKTDWDRDFTSNDKIKNWLLDQVQRVPFDPRRVSLLEYVKSRMQAAEAQQKQQQQQHIQQNQQAQPQAAQQSQVKPDVKPQTGFQQSATAAPPAFFQQSQPASKPFSTPSSYTTQPQATSSTSFSSTTQALPSNGTQANYTVLSDDESSGHQSDDQQYEFGLDDFDGKSSKESNANKGLGGDFFAKSRSPSPLPPPLAQRQVKSEPPTSSSSSSSMFPYSTGHPQQHIQQQSQQPFAQTPPIQQSFYHHQALPISQPVTLNPTLLFNNNNHNQQPQVIAPHQLSHASPPPLPLQVNAISHAQGIPFTPQVAPPSNPAFIANQNGKGKRKTEVEVVVPQRREDSLGPSNAAKRKKTAEAGTVDGARQPLGITVASSQQKHKSDHAQAQSNSVAASSTQSSVPSGPSAPTSTTSAAPPGPLTQGQKIWTAMKKDMERILHQASRSPHKTVNRMFKLLEPFVSEPPDATSRQGSREAFTTEILCPADLRITLLEVIKDDTNDDFDVIFVVDPRATVLLHEWTRDLALIAKGKYKGGEDPKEIMKTSRSLMAVLMKLPITLDVLRTLKGVGANVAIISKSDEFDEVTKDLASVLVKKWKAMVGRAGGPPKKAATPASAAAPTSAPAAQSTKKRPENADDEESRKKRKTSPAPSNPASSSTTAGNAATKATSSASAPAPIPAPSKGTAPLGRLPTTIKPVPVASKALPSFAKRKPMPTTAAAKAAPAKPAVPAAAPAPAPVAFDPFALSLQDMAASKESAAGIGMTVGDTLNMLNKAVDAASSSSSTMNTGASSSAMNSNIPKAGQYGKKKKSVRWPEDDKIKTIKYVEKLVYGDEFGNEITTSDYFNTAGEIVGEHEGVAMKGLVEQIDWEEPQLVDRKLSQEDLDLLVEYPHPELIDTSITKCERDIQAERDSTILATTFFNEDELPYSPAEPPASSMQDQQQEQPVIMKLSHDLANDQSVQLAILQAQTAAGRASADAPLSSSSNGQNMQSNNLYQAGSSLPPQGAVFNASHQQQSQTQPQQAMGVEVPPAVAGADLTSLLAQLSGSGLANLNTGFGSAPPPPPPAPLGYGQHQQHQPYQHQPHQSPYSHMQQYSQPYPHRY